MWYVASSPVPNSARFQCIPVPRCICTFLAYCSTSESLTPPLRKWLIIYHSTIVINSSPASTMIVLQRLWHRQRTAFLEDNAWAHRRAADCNGLQLEGLSRQRSNKKGSIPNRGSIPERGTVPKRGTVPRQEKGKNPAPKFAHCEVGPPIVEVNGGQRDPWCTEKWNSELAYYGHGNCTGSASCSSPSTKVAPHRD